MITDAPLLPALISKVDNASDADTARLTTIFKDLHQHPKIGFTEAIEV